MEYKSDSSAANRLAKQLVFFIKRNDISITDSISLLDAGSTTTVHFYKNHKHKNEKYNILYHTKTTIGLLKEFFHRALPLRYNHDGTDDIADSRVAFRKLLRILPITDPRLKPLISNIKRSEYRTPRFKYNDHKEREKAAPLPDFAPSVDSLVTHDNLAT